MSSEVPYLRYTTNTHSFKELNSALAEEIAHKKRVISYLELSIWLLVAYKYRVNSFVKTEVPTFPPTERL